MVGVGCKCCGIEFSMAFVFSLPLSGTEPVIIDLPALLHVGVY